MQDNLDEPKYCKDCKYETGGMYWFCENPKLGVSVIDKQVYTCHCSRVRNNQYLCGKDGKWFEPKPSIFEKVINLFKKG